MSKSEWANLNTFSEIQLRKKNKSLISINYILFLNFICKSVNLYWNHMKSRNSCVATPALSLRPSQCRPVASGHARTAPSLGISYDSSWGNPLFKGVGS